MSLKTARRETWMQSMVERLDSAAVQSNSLVCVGLDPEPARMPVRDVFEFNRVIIDATAEFVSAYKPQFAFYEALGVPGLAALEKTVQYLRDQHPGKVIVGDGKRGDIGSTATAYAHAMFQVWDVDIATVYAYQGAQSVEPFLQYPGRGVYVVCRTSNPSSRDIQDLRVQQSEGRTPRIFEVVADLAEGWGSAGNVGLVVGATFPEDIRGLRESHPDLPFLIPGVGAQGGDAEQVARAGANAAGRGVIINSSRQVIYASSDRKGFGKAAGDAARSLQRQINQALTRETS